MIQMERINDKEYKLQVLSKIGKLNPNEKYRSKYFLEFVVDEVDVDVMAGFAIVYKGKEYDCSLQKDEIKEYVMVNEHFGMNGIHVRCM